jgi:hypothetical protein
MIYTQLLNVRIAGYAIGQMVTVNVFQVMMAFLAKDDRVLTVAIIGVFVSPKSFLLKRQVFCMKPLGIQ